MLPTDEGFQELATIAFDVMLRRGWNPVASGASSWIVEDGGLETYIYRFAKMGGDGSIIREADPFTALRVADEWFSHHDK